jgi:hypothetical protein
MTTVTLSSTESRHVKALALLAQRGQWLTVKGRNGALYVGIPSQTKRGLVHLVATDGSRCDCYDFRNHGRGISCKHTVAVRLWLVSHGAEPQSLSASDTIDGLAAMLEQRLGETKPVLEMVRHDDGEISWRPRSERSELDKILGHGRRNPPTYETDHVAASKYDEIFERFDDDGPRGLQKESYL